jgi:hypothetical protein
MVGKLVVKIGEAVPPPIVAAAICFGSNDAKLAAPDSMSFKVLRMVEINCDWMVPIYVWIAKIGTFEQEPAMPPIRINSGCPFPICPNLKCDPWTNSICPNGRPDVRASIITPSRMNW